MSTTYSSSTSQLVLLAYQVFLNLQFVLLTPPHVNFNFLIPDLHDLPATVLSMVTELLHSDELAHLWLCGDSILSYKLQHGGVTHFWHTNHKLRVHTFPTLVMQFSQLLGIDLDFWTPPTAPPNAIPWNELPRTLQSIKMIGAPRNALQLFHNPEYGVLFPHLSTFSLATKGALPFDLDWSLLPPTLTDIRLDQFLCSAHEAAHWSLDALPRALTRLETQGYPTTTFNGQWPPHLTHLRIGLFCDFRAWPSFFNSLPNLTALYISSCDADITGFTTTLDDWKVLPPLLTTLHWNTYICHEFNNVGHGADWNDDRARKAAEAQCAEYCASVFKCLPPGLTSLSIAPFIEHADTLAHLPQGIRSLYGFSLTVNTETASRLPRSLVFISNLSVPTDAISALPTQVSAITLFRPLLALGPYVEELGVATPSQQTSSASSAASSSNDSQSTVASRRSDRLNQAIHLGFEHLQHLKFIRLKHLTFNTWRFPYSTLGQYLPSSIEEMVLTCTYGTEDDEFPSTLPELTERDLAGLLGESICYTPHLETLRIRLTLKEPEGLLFLPPTVQRLSFNKILISSVSRTSSRPTAEVWTQYLPRKLKQLRTVVSDVAAILDNVSNAIHLGEAVEAPTMIINLDWYKYLPNTLQLLDLVVSHFNVTAMKDLAAAAPKITSLRLRVSDFLDCNWIEDLTLFLPRSLQEFILDVGMQAFVEEAPESEATPAKNGATPKPLNLINTAFGLLPRTLTFLQLKRGGSRGVASLPPDAPEGLVLQCSPAIIPTERPVHTSDPSTQQSSLTENGVLNHQMLKTPVKKP